MYSPAMRYKEICDASMAAKVRKNAGESAELFACTGVMWQTIF